MNKDKNPKYRREYYRDKNKIVHEAIMIDIEEEQKTNGSSTTLIRSHVNPNLNLYKTIIINKNWEILKEYENLDMERSV